MPNGTRPQLSSLTTDLPSSRPTGGASSNASGGGGKALWKTLLPWAVALVAMVWVTRSVLGLPPQPAKVAALLDVLHRAPLALFVGASVLLLIANCAADTFAMFYTFRWFGCRLPYRELFVVRAATYVVAVVQYYVGQAAILAFLHNRRGVPFLRATGWILFISAINMGVLVLLAAVGLAGGDTNVRWLAMVPVAVGVGAAGYAVLLYLKPQGLARVRLFEPLFEMGIVGHIKATLVRLPHVLVLIVWHFLALRCFGVAVPPFTALVLLPAVFFAAALPVSVQGLGLSQMAAVYFFASYGPPPLDKARAAVLAYSLATTTVSLIFQIGMGLLFLPAGRRIGFEPVPERVEPTDVGAAVGHAVTAEVIVKPEVSEPMPEGVIDG